MGRNHEGSRSLTIAIKAGAGVFAGVIAGGLGYCFWPHVEPSVLAAHPAVVKPIFVVAAAASRPAPAPSPAPALAVPALTVVPKAGVEKLALALKTDGDGAPRAVTRGVNFAEPAAPTPAPSLAPVSVMAPARPPSPGPALASSSNEAAARLGAQGLVALADGDIAGARLFLQRAADAGDPRAWMALGETYDSASLTRLGVVGAHGDATRAHDCFAKALAAGVGAAKERIAALEARGN